MKEVIVVKAKGFTLIELMIVVVILSLLAAFAIPAYNSFVERGWRAEARAEMTELAHALERNYSVNNTYNMTLPASTSTRYSFTLSNDTNTGLADARGFLLTATLNNDSRCSTLTLTNTGLRGSTSSAGATSEECWNK